MRALRVVDLRAPAAHLLAERQRHRIHQVRAPGLDDLADVADAAADHRAEVRKRRQQVLLDREQRAQMNRRRNHVVRALAHVDVIVGMHGETGVAAGEVRDHLVGIHVAAGARAGLEDVDRELRVVPAFGDFERRLLDGGGALRIERVELEVRGRRRPLDQPERADELARHAQPADREVLDRTLRLRAPQRVGGDLQLARGCRVRCGNRRSPRATSMQKQAVILRYYSTPVGLKHRSYTS